MHNAWSRDSRVSDPSVAFYSQSVRVCSTGRQAATALIGTVGLSRNAGCVHLSAAGSPGQRIEVFPAAIRALGSLRFAQQVVAIGAVSLDTPIVRIVSFLLAYRVSSSGVTVDWRIQNRVTVGPSLSPAVLKL